MNNKKKIVGIIQARMGSKRLPGKSMMDLAGHPLVWHVLQRVKRSKRLDVVVLATTSGPEDDVLEQQARECGVEVFRGSESDLVDRYYQAAKHFGADIVVRACADNPVLEPEEIDRIIDRHLEGGADFSSNTHEILDNRYPNGLGAEVLNIEQLEELWNITSDPEDREHPHRYFYAHPEQFRIATVMCPPSFQRPDLKLDVNTPDEYEYLKAMYEYCYPRNSNFHITDIVRWHDTVYAKKT